MKRPFFNLVGTALLVPLFSLSLSFPSQAQGPNHDGPPPRGDFGGRGGEMRDGGMRGDGPRGGGGMGRGGMGRARGQMQLERMWRGIGRLEQSGHPLSKAQSQNIVSLILPWSKTPQMTQASAQALRQRLQSLLTTPQKNELRNAPFGPPRDGMRPDGGRDDGPPRDGMGADGPPRDDGRGDDENGDMRQGSGRGGPGGGMRQGGRRGGEGRRGGGMRGLSASDAQIVRAWMETSNPFYAPTGTATWEKLPAAIQTRVTRRYKQNRVTLEALSRRAKS